MAFSIVLAVGITVSGFSSSLFLAQISLYILANQILYISSQLDACHARAHAGHRHSHLPEIATGGRREPCLITTVGRMGGNRAAAATPVHALTPLDAWNPTQVGCHHAGGRTNHHSEETCVAVACPGHWASCRAAGVQQRIF